MTTSSITMNDAKRDRSQKVAAAAIERAAGDKLSPTMKRAALEAIAPWAERWVRWLDDFIRIPGTRFGIGLDPILGLLLPGAGDAVTGVGSVGLLFLALKERVPTVVLGRMILNIAVDTLGGLMPIAGDAFDLVWRSNRRNLELIERYRRNPNAKPRLLDYVLVGGGVVLAILSILIPLVIVYGIGLGAILGAWNLFER